MGYAFVLYRVISLDVFLFKKWKTWNWKHGVTWKVKIVLDHAPVNEQDTMKIHGFPKNDLHFMADYHGFSLLQVNAGASCQDGVIQSQTHPEVHLIGAISTPGWAGIVAAIRLLPGSGHRKKSVDDLGLGGERTWDKPLHLGQSNWNNF